jgi:hypothetical protein
VSHIHTFPRPEIVVDTRQVGDVYSNVHNKYDEGTRYTYRNGAHDLVLFWSQPTVAEIQGVRSEPVELALYTQGRPPSCSTRSTTSANGPTWPSTSIWCRKANGSCPTSPLANAPA